MFIFVCGYRVPPFSAHESVTSLPENRLNWGKETGEVIDTSALVRLPFSGLVNMSPPERGSMKRIHQPEEDLVFALHGICAYCRQD